MNDLIKVPDHLLSEIVFEIKEVECEDSNYETFEDSMGYDEPILYHSRSAHGRVYYVADFQGQELTLSFDWEADASNKQSYKDTFNFSIDIAYNPNETLNFIVVDEDGDDEGLSLEDIECDVKFFEDFRDAIASYLPTIGDDEVLVEIEVIEMNEVNEYIVERDNDVDLKFKGQVLAYATSKDNYNDKGRWIDLTLYQTIGGKYICQKEEITRWQGERDRNRVVVCDTIDDVKGFFGNGWLSKELYASAGIENTETID